MRAKLMMVAIVGDHDRKARRRLRILQSKGVIRAVHGVRCPPWLVRARARKILCRTPSRA
jgi:hypothetical protein